MASLPKISDLVDAMIGAAKKSLGNDWAKAQNYAKPEFTRLARSLVDIGALAARGEISTMEAKSLLAIHMNTTKTVLLTVEGLGLLAVQKAINAALAAVREAVNAAAGIAMM